MMVSMHVFAPRTSRSERWHAIANDNQTPYDLSARRSPEEVVSFKRYVRAKIYERLVRIQKMYTHFTRVGPRRCVFVSDSVANG